VRAQGEPVFVDGSGRRRRIATVMGAALGTGLLASLGLIVAGLFGVSSSAPPGLPDRGGAHAEQVPVQPDAGVGTSPRSPSSSHGSSSARPSGTPSPAASSPRRTGPPPGHGKPSRSG